MKNLKLILKSLFSNNACIEGGYKKPWYFAAIMFFLSMIFAILPLFVQTMNTNGDDVFKTNAYGLDQAATAFTEQLNNDKTKIYVKTSASGEKFISCENEAGVGVNYDYPHYTAVNKDDGFEYVVDYNFHYRTAYNEVEFNELIGDKKTSFVIIYPDRMVFHVVNFNTKDTIQSVVCMNAPKYLNEGRSLNETLSNETDSTKKVAETFGNWKLFIRDSYNFTRLTGVWQTCTIMGAINVGITLFMGLMIWILTRGKANPYRLFNLWHSQKMAWWAAITPSILALAFGFLIPRFANILYPMLIGIRVMWLSMKSLRPDGSGYAAQ